jgi:hypothetical protein
MFTDQKDVLFPIRTQPSQTRSHPFFTRFHPCSIFRLHDTLKAAASPLQRAQAGKVSSQGIHSDFAGSVATSCRKGL